MPAANITAPMSHPDLRAPLVSIRPVHGAEHLTEETLFERLLEMSYEDSGDKPPEIKLRFADPFGEFFDLETLALGVEFEISFGYGPNRIVRDLVVRNVAGYSSPNSGVGIELSGRPSLLDRLHRRSGSAHQAVPAFDGLRVTDAVRTVAQAFGFAGASAVIEDNDTQLDHLTFREDETAAQFIGRMAKLLHYTWSVRRSTFHFHSYGYTPTRGLAILALGGHQVLSWHVEGDLSVPSPSTVEAKGYDPQERLSGGYRATPADLAPQGGGYVVDTGPVTPDSAQSASQENLVATDIIPTSLPGAKARARAVARLRARADRQWKLRLKLTGTPEVLARMYINLVGRHKALAGEWYVRGVRHSFTPGEGYVTEITEATRRGPAAGRRFSSEDLSGGYRFQGEAGQVAEGGGFIFDSDEDN